VRLSGNTILITGGTSGIGLELATRFAALDNTVIITGRNPAKLDAARKTLPSVHAIRSDASEPAAIAGLYDDLAGRLPDLNMAAFPLFDAVGSSGGDTRLGASGGAHG
jgi:uncharacterized oxidoreductase